jgi:hypothetical protein
MFEGDHYETLAICRTLDLTRAAFAVAIEGEARRPVRELEPDPHRETASRKRLVRADPGAW